MILRAISGLVKGRLLGKKIPLKVQHIITFRCNFKCKYCGLYDLKSEELSTKEIKDMISFFREKGVVSWTFTGGEPLLRSDMRELLDHLKKLDIMVNITTNGTMVEKNINWLDKFDMVSISLDGPKIIHEYTRGSGNYDIAVNAIKLLTERGVNTAVSAVLTKDLLKDECKLLIEYLEVIKDLNVKAVFLPVYKDEFNMSNEMEDITPSQKEYDLGLKILEDYKKHNKGKLLMSKPTFRWLRKFYDNNPIRCYAGQMFLTIYPDGGFTTCMFKQNTKVSTGDFAGRFKNLEKIKRCSCKTNCYFEYNNMISMKPQTMFDLFSELKDQLKN